MNEEIEFDRNSIDGYSYSWLAIVACFFLQFSFRTRFISKRFNLLFFVMKEEIDFFFSTIINIVFIIMSCHHHHLFTTVWFNLLPERSYTGPIIIDIGHWMYVRNGIWKKKIIYHLFIHFLIEMASSRRQTTTNGKIHGQVQITS